MEQVTAIVLGAGNRGAEAYADYAIRFPNELKIVGVAEPRRERREAFSEIHHIKPENCVESWEKLLVREKLADCAIICTPDEMHYAPVMSALKKGYDVLCEKPMSTSIQEMLEMSEEAKKRKKLLSICHVLRYSPFFIKVKELLDQGAIGQLVSIQHIECVGYWHMAHSFVRGNWKNSDESSPMILAKCCHDMDILSWLVQSRCLSVSSFGDLMHFRPENKPMGAPDYCADGCRESNSCPYYAPKLYLENTQMRKDGFDKIVSLDTSKRGLLEALKRGPYGRCVYACNNNVVDHQVVNMFYENGVTINMTMCGFTEKCEREINLMGSKGQIKGNMEKSVIEYSEFATGNHTTYQVAVPLGGHSGSDVSMMREFVELVSQGECNSKSDAMESVESHLIALAAEKSRLQGGAPIKIDSLYLS